MGWTDRNVEFPNRYRLVKVPGTDDIYELEPAPGEVVAEGTFVNKANMLTDETAALLGGAETVNEALRALGIHSMNFHYVQLTTSGTWIAPGNIVDNKVHVMAFGGGGAGGYAQYGNNGGAGGGGGGYMNEADIIIVPGQSYEYVIGTGGIGIDVSTYKGNDGGTTRFESDPPVEAAGGSGGAGRTGTSGGNGGRGGTGGGGGYGSSGGSGGIGTYGGNGSYGEDTRYSTGGKGVYASGGTNNYHRAGGGGGGYFGAGGAGASQGGGGGGGYNGVGGSGNGGGASGYAAGGGGGGYNFGQYGGNGAQGIIILTYYTTTKED